jgi:hypothetical protein
VSDSVIHPNNEITGLVPVNHHQHEESRKFQKRKKNDKDNPHPDIPEEAVEDLLHHPEDEDDPDAARNESSESTGKNDARDHLDMLL